MSRTPLSSVVQSLPPSSPSPSATPSKTTPASSSTTTTAPTAPPPTTAIYKLSSPLSGIYTHLHTPLVLSTLLYSFPSLVASPVDVLLYSLVPLALLQSAYCALCLQPAHAFLGAAAGKKKKKKTKIGPAGTHAAKKEEGGGSELAGSAITVGSRLLLPLVYTILSAFPLILLTLLLGAPLTTHLPHTVLLTLHLALLAFYPLFYARPLSARHWTQILSLTAPLDDVYGAAVGALMGAWLGAVPIPLDWDRAWQAWPVTVVVGGYAGWAVGRVVGGVVGGRWRGSWE